MTTRFNIPLIREDIVLYFLTEVFDDHPVAYIEDEVKNYLARYYRDELVDEIWELIRVPIISDLVNEYNHRLMNKLPLGFTFVEDDERKIRGKIIHDDHIDHVVFQRALLALSDTEFEKLSARVLMIMGCVNVTVTPASHDQVLDAFGFMAMPGIIVDGNDNDEVLRIWMLVQAKHYAKEKVRTSEVREFTGAKYLASYRVFVQAGEVYKSLVMKPLSPIALLLVTSGEISADARALSRQAGIICVTANDLCHIFARYWQESGLVMPRAVEDIAIQLRNECELVTGV